MRAATRQEAGALHVGAFMAAISTPGAAKISEIAANTRPKTPEPAPVKINAPGVGEFKLLSRPQYQRARDAVLLAAEIDGLLEGLAVQLHGLGVTMPLHMLRGEMGRAVDLLQTAMLRSDYAKQQIRAAA